MKLVVIMSITEYTDVLEKLYAEHQVPVFSEADIQGFKLETAENAGENWFGHNRIPIYSKLTFAFVTADKAADLLAAINTYNEAHDGPNPIRAFQMHVEGYV